jgi:hypothetical protein
MSDAIQVTFQNGGFYVVTYEILGYKPGKFFDASFINPIYQRNIGNVVEGLELVTTRAIPPVAHLPQEDQEPNFAYAAKQACEELGLPYFEMDLRRSILMVERDMLDRKKIGFGNSESRDMFRYIDKIIEKDPYLITKSQSSFLELPLLAGIINFYRQNEVHA